ncbi:hypothetical protein CI109_104002 [Kwoniella shandongensis]|uniref:Uncharacterized protein n=1 Tax=Kwoniella shandongensis TaxID=1734106 RepID=A0A5M6BXL4_9TREE|nr:uncharacterized protein CI109_004113 [Kwoniella shandongensis]KAA5527574.1 hypothetical protein CI109_004113 [Kwoniella shandongensis]
MASRGHNRTRGIVSGIALFTLLSLGAVLTTLTTTTNLISLPNVLLSTTTTKHNKHGGSICPQPDYSRPFNSSGYFDTPQFWDLQKGRLSEAIRHNTVSYDDLGDPLPAKGEKRDERWDVFDTFQTFLRETYPLSFSKTKVEKVGGYTLILTLEGTTDAKPLLLTGHQDTVGVGSLADWDHPPFDGYFDGEFIWGRGSSDCKTNVIGLLSVLEHLLENEYTPRRTLILGFTQDEESGGRGSTAINATLGERYGKNGIELILDEGGAGLNDEWGPLLALPGLAEKGIANLQFTVTSPGGHSSVPPKHTSIGFLAHILSLVEDADIFQPALTTSHPYYHYLECVSEHGDPSLVPKWLDSELSNGNKKDLSGLARKVQEIVGTTEKWLLTTTRAVTRIGGGIKNNVLPDEAHFLVNSRLEVTTTPQEYVQTIVDTVLPLASKLDLTVKVSNQTLHTGSSGILTIEPTMLHPAAPITSWKSPQWAILGQAIRATWGPETITAPSLATGNTDTARYWDLTENIVRWTPLRVEARVGIHGANERIQLKSHLEAVKFYHELILRFDEIA